MTGHQAVPGPEWTPRTCPAHNAQPNCKTTFPQLSVDAKNFQSYKKHVKTFTKATSIRYHEAKWHHSASGGLQPQITGVFGIFLKMHYYMLALLFYFSKLLFTLPWRGGRARLALGLTAYSCFYLAYQCDVLSNCDCVRLSDSKDVSLQLEDEKEPGEIRKWRGQAYF